MLPQAEVKLPLVCLDLVERLVVEGSHQLGVGRTTVGVADAQCPCLLLPWCKLVAEGGPLHFQFFLRQRPAHDGLVMIESGVFHPAECHADALAVVVLIGQCEGLHRVVQLDVPHVEHLLATDDGVEHMHVGIARAHLHVDGFAVTRKLLVTHVEPVAGLGGWASVAECEDHEGVAHGVALADGSQQIGTRGEFLAVAQDNGPVGGYGACQYLARIGATGGDGILHGAVDGLSHGVQQCECHFVQAVAQHLLGQVYLQHAGLGSQGQRTLALPGLSAAIGHVGSHLEVIVVAHSHIRQLHGYAHPERAVAARGCRCLQQFLAVVVVRKEAPPAEGLRADYLVRHLGALHGHAAIGGSTAHQRQRVAMLVAHGGFLYLDEEGRPLVFFHAERQSAVVHLDGILSVHTFVGQLEVGMHRPVGISHGRACLYHLSLSVAQLYLNRLSLGGTGVDAFVVGHSHSPHVYGLSWPVDAAVGEDVEEVGVAHLPVIPECPTHVLLAISPVGVGIGEETLRLGRERHHVLALCVAVHRSQPAVLLATLPHQVDVCMLHRLSGGRVDDGQTGFPLGQPLHQQGDVSDVEIVVYGVKPRVAGDVVNDIHACGHSPYVERVAEHLVARARRIGFVNNHAMGTLHGILLHHFAVLPRSERILNVLADVDAGNLHLQVGHALQLGQTHQLGLARQHILIALHHLQPRALHLVERIAQLIASRIVAPTVHAALQPLISLRVGHILHTIHNLVLQQGSLATLRQIAIPADNRVELVQQRVVGIFLIIIGIAVFPDHLDGSHHGSLAALGLRVVATAHHLGHVGLVGNQAQQVVTVDVAKVTLLHERLIGRCLGLTEQQRVGQGLLVVVRRRVWCHLAQLSVVGDGLAHHSLIDSLQHGLALRVSLIEQTLEGRFQRVGRNGTLCLDDQQLGLHQVPVGFLFLCLADDFLQTFYLCAGFVGLPGVLHVRP